MSLIRLPAWLLLATCVAWARPVAAQVPPTLDAASPPPKGASPAGPHAARHACLAQRLSALHQEMADHMAHYLKVNPTAKRFDIHLEHHTFGEKQKLAHADEIAQARNACGYKHRPIQ
jgi:hypothetical protein